MKPRSLEKLVKGVMMTILIIVIAIAATIFSCHTEDKTSNSSTKKEITIGQANIKNKLYITDSHSVSVKTVEYKDGHELIITIFAAGTAGSVSSMHDPILCAKCRSERGLSQIK